MLSHGENGLKKCTKFHYGNTVKNIIKKIPNLLRFCYWVSHWSIKYYTLKILRKKPLRYWEARYIWEDEYSPGNNGIYASDGVYFSLNQHAILHGYIPLWLEEDARGNLRYAYTGNLVGFFNHK